MVLVAGTRKYAGQFDGRSIELFSTVKDGGNVGGGVNLAVGLRVYHAQNFPHEGYARCARRSGAAETYETAFPKARMGLERLSPSQKEALASFVRENGCLFLEAEKKPAHLEVTIRNSESPDELKKLCLQLCQLCDSLD